MSTPEQPPPLASDPYLQSRERLLAIDVLTRSDGRYERKQKQAPEPSPPDDPAQSRSVARRLERSSPDEPGPYPSSAIPSDGAWTL